MTKGKIPYPCRDLKPDRSHQVSNETFLVYKLAETTVHVKLLPAYEDVSLN